MTKEVPHPVDTPINTIARCLTDLIVNQNLENSLQNIVEWLATSLNIDHCYILKNNVGSSTGNIISSRRGNNSSSLDLDNIINTTSFSTIQESAKSENRKALKICNYNLCRNPNCSILPADNSHMLIPIYSGIIDWGSLNFYNSTNSSTWQNNKQELEGLALAIGHTIENNELKDHKHKQESLLNESNEKLKAILNNSKEIILTLNLETNIIENVNDAVSILGYSPQEWIGQNYKSWNNRQRRQFNELKKLASKNGLQVKSQQICFSNKDNNEQIFFEFSTSIFKYKNSQYLLCVLRDIRERLKYEESINCISSQLTNLINNIDDVYAIYDIKTAKYDFVSDNVAKLYDCNKETFNGNTFYWRDVIHKQDVAGVEEEVANIIASKGKGEISYRIETCVGKIKMILEKLVVGKDEHGNASKLYIVKTDCTNIENAEQSLLETERKFRFISENISDFISIHDPDWNFTYASPSIKNILGYTPEEVMGKGGFDFVHPEDVLRTLDDSLQPIILEKKETQIRYRIKAKDDSYKWVETYSKPVVDSNGQTSSIISSTRDVTEQVNAEDRLRASEERFRLLSENSNDVISIHHLDSEFVYVSPSITQVLGYTPSEVVGKKPSEIISTSAESKLISSLNFKAVIESKANRKYINRAIAKNGDERSMEVVLQPIFKNDQIVSIQAATRDVTEREQLLRELEQSLKKERELNDLRSMFVSTASHQFRTPLTVIQSGIEIMEMYLQELPIDKQTRFQKHFGKIQDEIDRLQHLMNDVLLVGRANAARTPFYPSTGNIVTFCEEIITEKYNNHHPHNRKVLLQITGEQQVVDFDEKLLSHVVENIISNAYKYSRKGNLLFKIEFQNEEVELSIADSGIGIPEEDLKNLFQPFFRAGNTCDIEGTGLGLSIVKEFVDKHSGRIFLTSKLNKGTTVSVILPIKHKINSL